ncbi:MAG: [FeFe] hydrogenase H-cluster radical SAM maturase HydE [Candidatus Omnitrophica bacterium]|nr:[FeFe] hydrogenase H-cluster radical SAM maturase HydE [Candidatus Omnitrophota bacterium]
MCYAIPGKIVEIQPGLATINYFGETRKARNDFFNLAIGDYVYAQGGLVIQKVREDEALLSLEAWKELFFELKKRDNKLSKFSAAAYGKVPITKEKALELLSISDKKEKELLFKTANSIRQKALGNACCVHGIIEFSNTCAADCLYCGIRRSNTALARYRMTPQEIMSAVKEAAGLGFKALVLQSGEDPYYTKEIFEKIVAEVHKEYGALIFLSVGERDRDFYAAMFKAGARGVLLRFETSNSGLYAKIKPGASFEKRIENLNFLKDIGYLIATGALLGLPGSTNEDLIADVLLARSFGTEMYSFGPFIPHPETPLRDTPIVAKDEVFKFIAVTRLMVPDAKILVTTALETIGQDARRLALMSGANSFMLNVTPIKYRRQYEIYKNRANIEVGLKEQVEEALSLLKDLGRAPTDLGL